MSAVSAAALGPTSARKREGGRWRVGERGWIVLCAGKKRKERLLWYVYMSVRPRSHWSNLWMWVYTLKSLASFFPNINITISVNHNHLLLDIISLIDSLGLLSSVGPRGAYFKLCSWLSHRYDWARPTKLPPCVQTTQAWLRPVNHTGPWDTSGGTFNGKMNLSWWV